jgi:hypothetical protein
VRNRLTVEQHVRGFNLGGERQPKRFVMQRNRLAVEQHREFNVDGNGHSIFSVMQRNRLTIEQHVREFNVAGE